jgi:hypothetical protein
MEIVKLLDYIYLSSVAVDIDSTSLSSGMWRPVFWYKGTIVSEEITAPIFSAEKQLRSW